MSEIWKPVAGYEGIYEVSNSGRVRSLDRDSPSQIYGRPITKRLKGRILKPFYDKDGYHQVRLCGVGRPRSESIHRIVCRAFHGPKPSPQHEVAHCDGVKANNRDDNLRWSTHLDNCADRTLHGVTPRGEQCSWAKLTTDQARALRHRIRAGEVSWRVSQDFGVSAPHARAIAAGQRWPELGA